MISNARVGGGLLATIAAVAEVGGVSWLIVIGSMFVAVAGPAFTHSERSGEPPDAVGKPDVGGSMVTSVRGVRADNDNGDRLVFLLG